MTDRSNQTCQICPDCNRSLPLTEENFSPDGSRSSGFLNRCKPCQAARQRRSYRRKVESGEYSYNKEYRLRTEPVRRKTKRAIRDGEIERVEICQNDSCCKPAQEVHHWSYDKEDSYKDISFFCRACHRKIHRKVSK